MQVLSKDIHRNKQALEKAATFSLLMTNRAFGMVRLTLCPSSRQYLHRRTRMLPQIASRVYKKHKSRVSAGIQNCCCSPVSECSSHYASPDNHIT